MTTPLENLAARIKTARHIGTWGIELTTGEAQAILDQARKLQDDLAEAREYIRELDAEITRTAVQAW